MGASAKGRRSRHGEAVLGVAVGSLCRKKERREEVWERQGRVKRA